MRKGCSNDPIFDTKTVTVGQNVTLSCFRDRLSLSTQLFWIRLVSQTFPEVLGATVSNDYEGVEKTNHITTKQEPGAFVLHITETQLSDTAVYYCLKVKRRTMTFLNGIFLRIKGPEADDTAVTQYIQSDPVHPGDPVSLQCSVLSDSEKNTCTEDHRVYWFRAGSDRSDHGLIYAQRNSTEECEQSTDAPSVKRCVYSFSKDMSSSDAGTYYCAVATCGEILFGNGTKLDNKVGI
ncbi:uncharacterized protein LOC125008530 [Mugil cephalus]|uniref:uncharacterized protein LOC125008530 n=1 Tax=Mugil cephalus TaxID=48193 RepID=UPI001FB76C90|nr:uncharacterized protein LOC125008530 [Mugil cephalus]